MRMGNPRLCPQDRPEVEGGGRPVTQAGAGMLRLEQNRAPETPPPPRFAPGLLRLACGASSRVVVPTCQVAGRDPALAPSSRPYWATHPFSGRGGCGARAPDLGGNAVLPGSRG